MITMDNWATQAVKKLEGERKGVTGSKERAMSDAVFTAIKDFCVQDEEFADATPEDVYKALMVSQYYKDTVDPDDFNKIFTLSEDEIRTRLHRMGKGAQTNFIVAANEAIRSGRLDSLKKIRAIEECLGCELIQIQ